jgi:hypothetical protein
MGLELSVTKDEETSDYCVYAFGPPDDTTGRVRLLKASGDVEITALPGSGSGPDGPFYLAHLVPRLHEYHETGAYPDRDRWAV